MAEETPQRLSTPIADAQNPTSGPARIPYNTRLVMGSVGNLQGLKSRLPTEFPQDTERVNNIITKVNELIFMLQSLLTTKGQDPQDVQTALSTEAQNRRVGQQNKEGC